MDIAGRWSDVETGACHTADPKERSLWGFRQIYFRKAPHVTESEGKRGCHILI